MSDLYMDGMPVKALLQEALKRHRADARNADDMFWASGPRPHTDQCREVLQAEFSGPRLVNYVSFQAARYPQDIKVEYWDPKTDDWAPLREPVGTITQVDRTFDIAQQESAWEGPPATFEINDSFPVQITASSNARQLGFLHHPQHPPGRHWVDVKWKVIPVTTKAIRLILVRRPRGFAPIDVTGHPVQYSLAVRNLQVGYRVHSARDVPAEARATREDFSTSTTLLGARLNYRLKEYSARNVLSDIDGLHWKSEPQPVNYAVVNFFLDVRDNDGVGQVIDRIYLDPLTVGPTMNLYYTEDDPDSDFAADDSALTYPVVQTFGAHPEPIRNLLTQTYDGINFPSQVGYGQVDNGYLQWDPVTRNWWVGVSLRLNTLTGDHPIMSWSGNTLRLNGRTVEFTTRTGKTLSVAIPAAYDVGDNLNIALGYVPEIQESPWLASGAITLKIGTGKDPLDHAQETLGQILLVDLGPKPRHFFIGAYSTAPNTPGTGDFTLRGLALFVDKPIERGVVDGFINNPDLFVLKSTNPIQPDFTDNALMRVHSTFISENNLMGAVGGPGHRYEDVVWTPISRDFILRQGYVRFPPTRAKHFKMEFTNLVLQTYENLVPIRRNVKLFPGELVRKIKPRIEIDPIRFAPVQPRRGTSNPALDHDYTQDAPGVQTMMQLVDVSNYDRAVTQLRLMSDTLRRDSHTEAYVSDGPTTWDLADKGWIWSFTPWHQGVKAPKWDKKQKHAYEEVTVSHKSRIGFVVGLRHVQPHRVDYLTDDDTDVYEEPFRDTQHISNLLNVQFDGDAISAISNSASITSKTFPSIRDVRGVQFATIQSDNMPLLPDDGFVAEELKPHWLPYGDASLTRIPNQGVMVTRGVMAVGDAGGGIQSEAVSASPAGRVYAAARVTAQTDMGGVVRLEIVSVNGGVLAAEERSLTSGEEVVLKVGYQVGTALDPNTYGELEVNTYGTLEEETYSEIQTDPIGGPIFVRVYQTGPSNARFLVERLSLFDAPISWQFSVDDGVTWFDGLDVRNHPRGVLTFPLAGKKLRWRANIFHLDAEISHLTIRPWYGGLVGVTERTAEDYVGPNRSVIDDYPDVLDDPMWSQRHDPIPDWWYRRDVASRYGSAPNTLVLGDPVVPDVENITPPSPEPA